MASLESSSASLGRTIRPKAGRFSASLGNLRGRTTSRELEQGRDDGNWSSTSQNGSQVSVSTDRELPLPLPPPPLPPKDSDASYQSATTPPPSSRSNVDATPTNEEESYFDSYRLSRPGSIYSLSRVSFSSQISQLTAIQMPQASSLATSIASIPSAGVAARALKDAAEQLQRWTYKASELLSGLDAEDDVEWAAAAGRDGLGEVDVAINRFEGLIQVYVGAVEDLQVRQDISSVPAIEQKHLVDQIEAIAKEWQNVKNSLHNVKYQVELAMEWEELWNSVLGDIGKEIDALSSLVFEMEEKRHQSPLNIATSESAGIDIGELESIVDSPTAQMGMSTMSHRFSFSPAFPPNSPLVSPGPSALEEESGLLGIFARMQPLRASLDFLPMRLAAFHNRSSNVFPTACDELQRRKTTLEQQWKRLETDAEALRRELGEDRWVLVFKNAGRQASKMMDSVVRSITKLDEALDSNTQLSHAPSTSKKIDNYDAKKLHYGPAIERVLAIVDKGVKERLTVNGEIIRLQADLRQKWQTLQADIRNMDSILKHFNGQRHKPSRDSVSTVLSVSSEHSFVGSAIDTPGSSPASSICLPNRNSSDESKSNTNGGLRVVTTPKPRERRHSHIPVPSPTTSTFRNISTPQKAPYVSPYSQTALRAASQPVERPRPNPPPVSALPERPRWSVSTNPNAVLSTPRTTSTYGKPPPQSRSATSHNHSTPPQARSASSNRYSLHQPSPLSRKSSSTNLSNNTTTTTPRSSSKQGYRPPSIYTLGPGPYAQDPTRRSSSQAPGLRLRRDSINSTTTTSPYSHQASPNPLASPPMSPSLFATTASLYYPPTASSPSTSASPSTSRRTSVLPLPKARTSLGTPVGGSGAAAAPLDLGLQ